MPICRNFHVLIHDFTEIISKQAFKMIQILKVDFGWKFELIPVKSVLCILKIYTNYKLPVFQTNFLKLKLSNSWATFNLENGNFLSNPNINPKNGVAYNTCIGCKLNPHITFTRRSEHHVNVFRRFNLRLLSNIKLPHIHISTKEQLVRKLNSNRIKPHPLLLCFITSKPLTIVFELLIMLDF